MSNIKLDDDDLLRLEHVVLKQENAELRFALTQRDCSEERSELFQKLATKYSIDVKKFKISVNLPEKTLILTPLEVPAQ